MFRLQWPVKFGGNREQKAALGSSDEFGLFMQFGKNGTETASSAIALYTESTAVSIPINRVAEAFASIRPVIRDGDKIITDHPVLDLLAKPSPFYEQRLFMEILAKDYLITDENYVIALGGINRPPLELQPISPANISDIEGQNGLAISFMVAGNTTPGNYTLEYKKNSARYYKGNMNELKQTRGYSTKRNSLVRGQSPLVSAAAEARQNVMGNKYNTNMLEKGGRLSLVFHYEEDLDKIDFKDRKQRVQSQFGGPAGDSIMVSSGEKLDIKEYGTNNKDMDFANLQKMAKDAVALTYKVPLALISNDAAKFDNYGQSLLALYDDAVLPLADRIYGSLTTFLMPRFGLDPRKVQITYDILSITALRQRVLDEVKTRKDINIESDNELRPLISQEPYNGGNVILKPANMIPAGMDMETEPTKPVVVRDVKPDED